MNSVCSALLRFVPVFLVAAVWEVLPRIGMVRPEFAPSLEKIGSAWLELIASGELPYHAAASLTNLVIGLTSSICVGVLLGLMMAWHPIFNATAGTLLQMTFPIPRSAFVPVMILWLGLGPASKIAAIFSGSLLPIIVSAYNGARGIDRVLIWSAYSFGATPRRTLWQVVLPAALPDILSGVRNAISIAFILMVTSEFLIGGRGLGYLISFLGDAGSYAAMFAVVATVAALGFLVDRGYLKLMQWVLRWRD